MSDYGWRVDFIEHEDSFSHQLARWLEENAPISLQITHFRDVKAVKSLGSRPLVLSPGPNAPADCPESLSLVHRSLGKVPILGVCLGHQLLGESSGAQVAPVRSPRHGAARSVRFVDQCQWLNHHPQEFRAAAYNSLGLFALPRSARLLAVCENGEPQIVSWHSSQFAVSVQFHPESFLSSDQSWLKSAFANSVETFYRANLMKPDARHETWLKKRSWQLTLRTNSRLSGRFAQNHQF